MFVYHTDGYRQKLQLQDNSELNSKTSGMLICIFDPANLTRYKKGEQQKYSKRRYPINSFTVPSNNKVSVQQYYTETIPTLLLH